ncbi:hypothetical protein [Mobiluncus mulieris]|uniref:hypothetical protein n=1 Tax=Mobiluncus mulieris TaxID=2052 RepID=UPI002092EB4D|nr:hypothetical protein [Mobiluncus mulieris]
MSAWITARKPGILADTDPTPGGFQGRIRVKTGWESGQHPGDKLTAGVFARARAQGVGYDAPVAGEYELRLVIGIRRPRFRHATHEPGKCPAAKHI